MGVTICCMGLVMNGCIYLPPQLPILFLLLANAELILSKVKIPVRPEPVEGWKLTRLFRTCHLKGCL
jgi:hypothetical protein